VTVEEHNFATPRDADNDNASSDTVFHECCLPAIGQRWSASIPTKAKTWRSAKEPSHPSMSAGPHAANYRRWYLVSRLITFFAASGASVKTAGARLGSGRAKCCARSAIRWGLALVVWCGWLKTLIVIGVAEARSRRRNREKD
jgi:hypothetical protein